jgi:hypothetical protein
MHAGRQAMHTHLVGVASLAQSSMARRQDNKIRQAKKQANCLLSVNLDTYTRKVNESRHPLQQER